MNVNVIKEAQDITNILNDFLAPFDCTAFLGTDFGYYTESNTIEYALFVKDENADSFLEYAQSLFTNIHTNIFIWSFLHELGHHETEDDFEDEEWDEYISRINKEISCEEYYSLPIEHAATAWAGEYIQSHVEEVAKLNTELTIAIDNFLKAINYTE